jgi:dolichol-phosphate mannosyltransferase
VQTQPVPDAVPMDDPVLAGSSLVDAPTGSLLIGASPDASAGIRLSLVIPTFNESKNLETLVELLTRLFDPVLGQAYELIVVDDDSPDRTWELASALSSKYPRLRVMRRQAEKGLSTAVIRGWQVARGEVLGVMDADLQHPPEINVALLREIDRGADLAAGSRHVAGGGVSDWSMIRRLLSRGAQMLGLLILPGVLGRLSDPMSGLFMVKRDALIGVALNPIGYKILVEVVGRARIRWIGEVGYVFRERVEGESKVTWRVYFHYLLHLLRLRWATLPESRIFRFCVVGGTGVFVDMALLYLLSDPSTLGLGLTRSKFIAAEAAMLSNFLLNDAWTFGDLARKTPGFKAKARRFLAFNAICSIGLVLNIVLLNLLFNYAGMNRYVANAISILIVTAWNYGMNRTLNWAPLVTKEKASAELSSPPSGGTDRH